MILKKPYKDLAETLYYIKVQTIDSLPFAYWRCPEVNDPEELFNWLTKKVKYQNDPKGIELLQTMQTMFARGGRGDCDCFTIAALACMIVNGWDNIYVTLVGRKKAYPVHIYLVIYWNGERQVFDLTNKRRFNFERQNYKYIQELPVRWQSWGVNKYVRP